MADDCIVYWLFNDQCVCPWRHGYVGVSSDWKGRLKNHRRKFQDGFTWKILFRGTALECRALEWQLRPTMDVGWNSHPGGGKARLGIPHSAEVKQRMKEAAKHRPPMTDETREKLRLTSTGRTNRGRLGQKKSAEEIAKIAAAHTGKKLSSEHRAKLAKAKIGTQFHFGYSHSDETKQHIRMKKLGVAVHSEEFKQKQAERLRARNAALKGKPWSAARRLAWLQSKEA